MALFSPHFIALLKLFSRSSPPLLPRPDSSIISFPAIALVASFFVCFAHLLSNREPKPLFQDKEINELLVGHHHLLLLSVSFFLPLCIYLSFSHTLSLSSFSLFLSLSLSFSSFYLCFSFYLSFSLTLTSYLSFSFPL